MCSEVHYIIHCAADIRFTLSLVESLRANYCPTQALLELAGEAPKLRCFTYVSTAYVNSDLPKGETVKEMLYSDAISRATKKETDDATRARVLSLLLTVEKKKGDTQVSTPSANHPRSCQSRLVLDLPRSICTRYTPIGGYCAKIGKHGQTLLTRWSRYTPSPRTGNV